MWRHSRLHWGGEHAGFDPQGPDGGDRPHGDIQFDCEGLLAGPSYAAGG